jgi:pimeloyl-ACP methyl ester carboxylesterase
MRIVLLLAGLKDPKGTGLKRLTPFLEQRGWLVRHIPYGLFFLRGFLWSAFNKPLARMLACFTELLAVLGHEIVLVAHSNGATIAAEASKMGAHFHCLMFFNGATERNITLGPQTGYLINVCVPTDPLLNLSRIIAPLTPWAGLDGSLGSTGVKADSDPRMWNLNATEMWGIKRTHDTLAAENIAQVGPWVVEAVRWALGDNLKQKEPPNI